MAKRLATLAKVVLTVGLFGFLIQRVGWANILGTLTDARLTWLAGVYIALLGVRMLEAAQMRVLLSKVGLNVTVARVFFANTLSALYSFVLPGDLVASLAKWKALSAATGQKSTILNAIVYNRLALLLPVLAFGSVALVVQDPLPQTGLVAVVVAVWIVITVTIVSLYNPRIGGRVDSRLQRLASALPQWLGSRLEAFLASLRRFRSLRLVDHATILCISLLVFSSGLLSFLCAAYALELNVPVLTLVWTVALLRITRQLPLTISNIGVREGVLILALAPFGVSAAQAVALGLIALSKQIAIALIGFAYQVCCLAGWTRLDVADSQQSTSQSDDESPPERERQQAA
jgi:hypothetical protein